MCLARSCRTRAQAGDEAEASERRCPGCERRTGLIEPLSFPEVADLFDDGIRAGPHLRPGMCKPQAIKVVQFLLGCSASNVPANIELFVKQLLRTVHREWSIKNRYPRSGMIQATMRVIKENSNHGGVVFQAARLVKCCLELGFREEILQHVLSVDLNAQASWGGLFESP